MRKKTILLSAILLMVLVCSLPTKSSGEEHDPLLVLDETTIVEDLYETFLILSDNEKKLMIDDVSSSRYAQDFVRPNELDLKKGFYDVAKWVKFEVHNSTDKNNWLIEFAFPLIYEIHMYTEDQSGIEKIITSGANFPFDHREMDHRHFIFNLEIEP